MLRQLRKILALIEILEGPICDCEGALSFKEILKRACDGGLAPTCCNETKGMFVGAHDFFHSLPDGVKNRIAEIRRK